MEAAKLIEVLGLAERLKDTMRHCYTSGGRRESVAEHCWRMTLMAYFVSDEFPEANLEKLFKMCLIHDLGEAFTGDVPTFEKTQKNEDEETALLRRWTASLPEPYAGEMTRLYQEMEEKQSLEARIYKALDNLEALIQHNESDIETWLPLEYDLQMHYGDGNVAFSPYLRGLRELVRQDSVMKIERKQAKDEGFGGNAGASSEQEKNSSMICIREHGALMERAAQWFHEKWKIPKEAYIESMEACLKNEGAVPQWYLVLEGEDIIAGMGVIENDFHNRKDLAPNVCAVYVEEAHRRQGIAGRMLDFAVRDMAAQGIRTLYLLTDHTGFYERYGWEFLCMVQGDGEEAPSRMYCHRA